jgi:coatomer subunit beta'
VAITSDDSFYILRFDRDAYNEKVEAGDEITDEGVEEAFDMVADVQDRFTFLVLYRFRTINLIDIA